MDKFAKKLCAEEKEISIDNLLTDIYLLIKENYVAKVHCNGEYISIEFLNGQTFKLTLSAATR